jgi:hypothetical protein
MTRSNVSILNLENISDYLAFCEKAIVELEADESNVLRGFSAILAINHIPDWIKHKLTPKQRELLHLPPKVADDHADLKAIQTVFEEKLPALKTIRSVSNGFKHLRIKEKTAKTGYGCAYGLSYGKAQLYINKANAENDDNWTGLLPLTKQILAYWKTELSAALETSANA